MTARLIVIGGGEHACVVIETARSRPDLWTVEGFVDPRPCDDTQARLGVPWLGDDAVRDDAQYVIGVGAVGVSDVRARIAERYATAKFATIVHAHAWVSPTARLEAGAVVFAGAVVQTGAVIGAHAVVGTGTVIEHDVTLGAFVQTGPGVVIGGGATIGEASYLGLRACIRDHITVGARVMVGMGAVVTANAADGAIMLGVPARTK